LAESEYTGFGWTLDGLIRNPKRRIKSQSALARMLTAQGYPIKQQTISAYMRGLYDVPYDFVQALDRVLALDDDEQEQLAQAYTWAQKHEQSEPSFPGGATNERDFEEGLDAEARLRNRRKADEGDNGDSSRSGRV